MRHRMAYSEKTVVVRGSFGRREDGHLVGEFRGKVVHVNLKSGSETVRALHRSRTLPEMMGWIGGCNLRAATSSQLMVAKNGCFLISSAPRAPNRRLASFSSREEMKLREMSSIDFGKGTFLLRIRLKFTRVRCYLGSAQTWQCPEKSSGRPRP